MAAEKLVFANHKPLFLAMADKGFVLSGVAKNNDKMRDDF